MSYVKEIDVEEADAISGCKLYIICCIRHVLRTHIDSVSERLFVNY